MIQFIILLTISVRLTINSLKILESVFRYSKIKKNKIYYTELKVFRFSIMLYIGLI